MRHLISMVPGFPFLLVATLAIARMEEMVKQKIKEKYQASHSTR